MKFEQDEKNTKDTGALTNLSNSKKVALVEISKKSASLVAVSIGDLAVQFSNVYLFSSLGLDSLAASGLIYVTTSFIIDPFLAVTRQNAVFISQEFGKTKEATLSSEDTLNIDRYKNIGNIIRQGWYLSGIAAIPCGALLFGTGPALHAFGIDQEVSSKVGAYFFPVAFAVPFIMCSQINERFFSAVDQEKWLIPYRILTATIAIGTNIALIPLLGPQGGGLALLGQSITNFLISSLFISFKNDFRKFDLLNFKNYSGSYITKIAKQGVPIAAGLFLVTGSNFGVSICVGHLGNLRLAIAQVLSQMFGIATTITHSINEATNRLVAQKAGRSNFRSSRLYGNLGLISSMLVYAPIAVAYNLIPLQLTNIFIEGQDRRGADDLIRYSFILMSTAQFLVTVLDSTTLNLSALEDTLLASLVPFLAMVAVIFPLSALSTFLTNFDLYGITGSLNIGLSIAAAITTRYWLKQSNHAAERGFNPDTDTSNAKVTKFLNKFSIFKPTTSKEEYDPLIPEDKSMDSVPRYV